MLSQEPWCYTPDQWSRLTDWQICELYALPAAARAERVEAEAKGLPPPAAGAATGGGDRKGFDFTAVPPTHPAWRWNYLQMLVTLCKASPAEAERRYAEQVELWRREHPEG